MWLRYFTSHRGAAHIVAKLRQHLNGPEVSEGPGDGAAEEGGEGAAEAEGEGGGGKKGDEAKDLLPPAEEPTNQRRAMRPDRAEKRWRRMRKSRDTRRGGKRRSDPTGGTGQGNLRGGGRAPPRGKLRPPGIHPRKCAPVVTGSLWRLPASQRRGAPGQGNHGQICMAALLAPAC